MGNLSYIVEEYSENPLIIGGNFNICLNLNLDRKKLLDLIEEFDLVDVWRQRNLEKHQYTWPGKGKQGLVQSRLDFFLVYCSLEQQVYDADIFPGLKSDHSLVSLSINIFNTEKTSRGTWKLIMRF